MILPDPLNCVFAGFIKEIHDFATTIIINNILTQYLGKIFILTS